MINLIFNPIINNIIPYFITAFQKYLMIVIYSRNTILVCSLLNAMNANSGITYGEQDRSNEC